MSDDATSRAGTSSERFLEEFSESLPSVLNLERRRVQRDPAAEYCRIESTVQQAVEQETAEQHVLRGDIFSRLESAPDAPPGAGRHAVTTEELLETQRAVLFNGEVEACDGTSEKHDSLAVTIYQIGISLVSYAGSEGCRHQQLFRRDLRRKADDPVAALIDLLERRRRREGLSSSSSDELSELARRGIMSYMERHVLVHAGKAEWRMGHGSPAPLELIGIGLVDLEIRSIRLVRELVAHGRFVFVASEQGNRLLNTIGQALYPLEYVVIGTLADYLQAGAREVAAHLGRDRRRLLGAGRGRAAVAARVAAPLPRGGRASDRLRPLPRQPARAAATVLRPRRFRRDRRADRAGRQCADGAAWLPDAHRHGRPSLPRRSTAAAASARWPRPPTPARGHRTVSSRNDRPDPIDECQAFRPDVHPLTRGPTHEDPRRRPARPASAKNSPTSARRRRPLRPDPHVIGRTTFDGPGSEDMAVTVLLAKDRVGEAPSQSLLRIVSVDGKKYLGVVDSGPFAEPDSLRAESPILTTVATQEVNYLPRYHGRLGVKLLGEEFADGTLAPPRFRPLPNSAVYALEPEETAKVLKVDGDIRLGFAVGHDELLVGIPSASKNVLPRHTAILGTTGGGKSTTVAGLVRQAAKAGMAVILLDVEGEYTFLHEPTGRPPRRLAPRRPRAWPPPASPPTPCGCTTPSAATRPTPPTPTVCPFSLQFARLSPYAAMAMMDVQRGPDRPLPRRPRDRQEPPPQARRLPRQGRRSRRGGAAGADLVAPRRVRARLPPDAIVVHARCRRRVQGEGLAKGKFSAVQRRSEDRRGRGDCPRPQEVKAADLPNNAASWGKVHSLLWRTVPPQGVRPWRAHVPSLQGDAGAGPRLGRSTCPTRA